MATCRRCQKAPESKERLQNHLKPSDPHHRRMAALHSGESRDADGELVSERLTIPALPLAPVWLLQGRLNLKDGGVPPWNCLC